MEYTFKSIIDSLPQAKNSKSSWWVKLFIRKLSFVFTYLFINLRWSSNAVSYLSIFVSLTACVCFAIPSMSALVIAVTLINFWLVLDCVDGNIARCKKQKKVYGEFVDAISGYFTVAFVYLSIGIAAYNNGGILFDKEEIIIVIIGAVSSICDILARLIYVNFCGVITDDNIGAMEKNKINDKHSINYLRKRVSKELGLSGMFMPLTICGLVFNAYDLISIFYLCFNGLALISTAIIYLWKAEQYDKA